MVAIHARARSRTNGPSSRAKPPRPRGALAVPATSVSHLGHLGQPSPLGQPPRSAPSVSQVGRDRPSRPRSFPGSGILRIPCLVLDLRRRFSGQKYPGSPKEEHFHAGNVLLRLLATSFVGPEDPLRVLRRSFGTRLCPAWSPKAVSFTREMNILCKAEGSLWPGKDLLRPLVTTFPAGKCPSLDPEKVFPEPRKSLFAVRQHHSRSQNVIVRRQRDLSGTGRCLVVDQLDAHDDAMRRDQSRDADLVRHAQHSRGE